MIPLPPHRFLVAEDQTIFRELLVRSIREEFPGCSVTEAADLEGLKSARGHFDVALVDLELGQDLALDWLETWTKIPKNKAIILSAISEDYTLFRALRSPIMGYIHKEETMDTLKMGIRCVLNGAVFFSSKMQDMRQRMNADPAFFNKILSEREQEILELLGQGLGNDEIASWLGLKAVTVADHRKNIMTKLDLHNQAELMKYAAKKGFSRL